jgi:hypothetical protein
MFRYYSFQSVGAPRQDRLTLLVGHGSLLKEGGELVDNVDGPEILLLDFGGYNAFGFAADVEIEEPVADRFEGIFRYADDGEVHEIQRDACHRVCRQSFRFTIDYVGELFP